ncbi:MAG: FAD-binding oxidoreductase [Gammaproteobacteria bacterium]|nr:FAD-binding oxidoreductase [Gammaproteobacteria bacterium]MCW8986444.1 FAD-binding oxidoreductase [Gammaproteobacteria bacterium]
MKNYQSWGRFPKIDSNKQDVYHVYPDSFSFPEFDEASSDNTSFLPYAQGRSYGDVCQNEEGILLDTQHLDHFIQYDKEKGTLRCEAGVTFENILQLIVPHGWFLPVTPGTKYISVGGAIANDVHGKNHHKAGTFGRYVLQFELLRSNGDRLLCSPTENSDLFNATIGGLGLTGLINWAEFSLKKIPGHQIEQETIRFNNLKEFYQLSDQSDKDWEYTVAWIDCLAKGDELGRGLFMRGNHCNSAKKLKFKTSKLSVPFDAPGFLLNKYTVSAFNKLYFKRPVKQFQKVDYNPFFYPLDAISHWNRLYGKKGFMQYQCVVPTEHREIAMQEMLMLISENGQASFLSVLKEFGNITSPGLLSFPRPGITLALDFPNRGQKTLDLLNSLDVITLKYNGAVYPAKDARMSPESFAHYYPNWKDFEPFIDPHFSSDFQRRVKPAPESKIQKK